MPAAVLHMTESSLPARYQPRPVTLDRSTGLNDDDDIDVQLDDIINNNT